MINFCRITELGDDFRGKRYRMSLGHSKTKSLSTALWFLVFSLIASAGVAEKNVDGQSFYCEGAIDPAELVKRELVFQLLENGSKARVYDGAIATEKGNYIVVPVKKKNTGTLIFRWSVSVMSNQFYKIGVGNKMIFDLSTHSAKLSTKVHGNSGSRSDLKCKTFDKKGFWESLLTKK